MKINFQSYDCRLKRPISFIVNKSSYKNIQIRHYLGSRKQKIIRRYRIIFSSLWNPRIFRHYGILAILTIIRHYGTLLEF